MLSRIGLRWKAAGAVGAVATAAYSFVRHREQRSAEFLDKYWWNSAALIVADEDGHLNRDKNPPFVGTHGFNSDELLGRDAYSSLERMYEYHHSSWRSDDYRFKNKNLVPLRWETADQLKEALQATAAAPAALWVMTERQAAQCQEIELPLRFQRFSQGRDLADAKFDAVDLYSYANYGVDPRKPATPPLTLLDARVHQRPGARFGDFPECDHDAFAPMLAQAVAATSTVNQPAAAIDVLVTNEAVPGQALVETHARAGVDTVVFLAKPWSDERRGLWSARKLHGAYSRAVDAVRARAASSTELALPECVLVDSVSVDSLRESHPELWIDYVNHASATAIIEASKPKKTALVDAREGSGRYWKQGPSASGGLYSFSPFYQAEARAMREAEALAEQTQQDGVDNLIFGCDHSNIRGLNAAREYRDALRRRGAPADRQQRLYATHSTDGFYY
jgi:hypothetical protein